MAQASKNKKQSDISEGLAEEIRTAGENLSRPIASLVANTIEKSLDVAEVAVSKAGEVVEAFVDEADRVGKRVRRGLDGDK